MTLRGHRCIVSRRCKCSYCESVAKQQKDMALAAAMQAAAVPGAMIEAIIDDTEIVTEAA